MKKLKNLKSAKELLYEKVQTTALDFNMSFVMDDINEKEELIFFLDKNSDSYALRYDVVKDLFNVRVKSAVNSFKDDHYFYFTTLHLCMECISALNFYYEQIMETVKDF